MTIQEKTIEQLERVSRHLAAIGEKEDYTDIAIQALEQECEDAVSRQAVLDIVKFEENWLFDAKSNNADTNIAFSGIRAQVAKLSPVTPAPKKDGWIPCSERLPENDEDVLTTNGIGINICWIDTDDHKWRLRNDDYIMDSVIAWMPLPEKYKAETEGEE